jgi:uncharacterized membrane protein YoaK (UPF0700 family)
VRTAERAGLLVLLAAASGSADGWSFFGMGHAFVANMTGNTVLLGVSIFHLHSDYLHPLIALGSYVMGTILGTAISRRVGEGVLWTRRTSWVLFLESVFLFAAEIGWIGARSAPSGRSALTLLACVAMAIGLQSGAMVQLGVPGVATTYITGTWTVLTNGITRLVLRDPAVLREEKKYEERFELQAAVLAAYFLAAVLTGGAFRHVPRTVGALPATAVLLVATYGALRS